MWCLPLIICSFCMELKLFFTLIQLVLKLCDFFLKQWKTLNNCKHDVYCSFCMELKLFFTLIQLVLKLCDFFLKQWKTLNNCKHDIYCSFCMELDLLMQFIALHFMWDTHWIPTWMKYRVSWVSEYISIFYDLKLFQLNVILWRLLYNT